MAAGGQPLESQRFILIPTEKEAKVVSSRKSCLYSYHMAFASRLFPLTLPIEGSFECFMSFVAAKKEKNQHY